jgi:hypothetical protein
MLKSVIVSLLVVALSVVSKIKVSAPAPPVKVSMPIPPLRISFPDPADMISFPFQPYKVFLSEFKLIRVII